MASSSFTGYMRKRRNAISPCRRIPLGVGDDATGLGGGSVEKGGNAYVTVKDYTFQCWLQFSSAGYFGFPAYISRLRRAEFVLQKADHVVRDSWPRGSRAGQLTQQNIGEIT